MLNIVGYIGVGVAAVIGIIMPAATFLGLGHETLLNNVEVTALVDLLGVGLPVLSSVLLVWCFMLWRALRETQREHVDYLQQRVRELETLGRVERGEHVAKA
jgi:4-hydroxybenzoate polyprenyltransferase